MTVLQCVYMWLIFQLCGILLARLVPSETQFRAQYALGAQASVFSAALTTFCAAATLHFCVLDFFHKFGSFLALTMAVGVVLASVFFTALMAVAAPPPTHDHRAAATTGPSTRDDNDNDNVIVGEGGQ